MLDAVLCLIERYIADEISTPDFASRFAGLYARVRQDRNAPRAAAQLCSAVIGPLAEHSRGHRSELSLKGELANAIRPFASKPEMAPYSAIPQKISLFEKTRKKMEIRSDSEIQIEQWLCA